MGETNDLQRMRGLIDKLNEASRRYYDQNESDISDDEWDAMYAELRKLEEKTGNDIQNIRHEINDIKGDFATTFVLREDFFRSMNGVEDRMKIIDNKLDKLLLMGKENK